VKDYAYVHRIIVCHLSSSQRHSFSGDFNLVVWFDKHIANKYFSIVCIDGAIDVPVNVTLFLVHCEVPDNNDFRVLYITSGAILST